MNLSSNHGGQYYLTCHHFVTPRPLTHVDRQANDSDYLIGVDVADSQPFASSIEQATLLSSIPIGPRRELRS